MYCYSTCATCFTHGFICLCQVGIVLHYSSLSTLLWIGVSARVIYKEALLRTPQQPEGESAAQPTQRPMLRSVKLSWRAWSIRWLITVFFGNASFTSTLKLLDTCFSLKFGPSAHKTLTEQKFFEIQSIGLFGLYLFYMGEWGHYII